MSDHDKEKIECNPCPTCKAPADSPCVYLPLTSIPRGFGQPDWVGTPTQAPHNTRKALQHLGNGRNKPRALYQLERQTGRVLQ